MRVLFRSVVENVAVGVVAQAGDADLSRIGEDRPRGAGARLGDIDVRKDDDRRLAAQLQGNALQRVGGGAVDDLADLGRAGEGDLVDQRATDHAVTAGFAQAGDVVERARRERSEEHTSELQSLMRISYAVFCLKKK